MFIADIVLNELFLVSQNCDDIRAMKTLFLNRHAKSSWNHPGLSDHDRPLNDRGMLNAPLMAARFADTESVDLIVSSSANRALTTAQSFAKSLGHEEIKIEKSIYGAGVHEMIELIVNLPSSLGSVILFGHNPTFSILAQYLDHGFSDHMVTCSLVKIEFEIDSWEMVSQDSGRLVYHHYPRMYDEMKDL